MRCAGPTLADVARRAGVNRVTVSVVLNGSSGNTRVSEETRQRILRAAAELHYQPHAIARSLRRQRTDVIGFYYGDNHAHADSPFVGQVLAGLQRGCEESCKDLLLHNRRPGAGADAVFGEVASGKIDGLVLYVRPYDPLVGLLASSHLPVVAIVDAVPQLPSVVADDREGGRMQARRLAEAGRTRILYVDRPPMASLTSVDRRRKAFLQEAAALGLQVRIVHSTAGTGLLPASSEGLLAEGDGGAFDAVVAWEDNCAHSVVEACIQLGRRVPEEVAVIGYDGILSSLPQVRPLTTVRAPWQQVARTAVDVLLDQMEGRPVATETVLPVKLIPGATG